MVLCDFLLKFLRSLEIQEKSTVFPMLQSLWGACLHCNTTWSPHSTTYFLPFPDMCLLHRPHPHLPPKKSSGQAWSFLYEKIQAMNWHQDILVMTSRTISWLLHFLLWVNTASGNITPILTGQRGDYKPLSSYIWFQQIRYILPTYRMPEIEFTDAKGDHIKSLV